MKKDSFSEKSKSLLSRNYLKMHQLFWDHEKPSAFIGSIISIRKDLGIPEDLPFKDVYKKAAGSTEKFDLLEDKYQEIQASFLKKNEDKKAILQKGVNAILRKNNLGEEWEEMITLAIITGACFPPRYNVSISCDEEKGHEAAVRDYVQAADATGCRNRQPLEQWQHAEPEAGTDYAEYRAGAEQEGKTESCAYDSLCKS